MLYELEDGKIFRSLTDWKIFLILIGLFAISVISLEKESFSQEDTMSIVANLGSEFVLHMSQSAEIVDEDMRITFVNVTADSRCPADVMCVWQGRAETQVFVQKGDEEFIVTLSIGGDSSPEESIFDSYLIQLVELSPYPYSSKTIQAEEYAATFKIIRHVELQDEVSGGAMLPPLKQAKLGQEPSCKENLVLIKKYNGSPAW
jgi:hypothetical protein